VTLVLKKKYPSERFTKGRDRGKGRNRTTLAMKMAARLKRLTDSKISRGLGKGAPRHLQLGVEKERRKGVSLKHD